MKFRNVLTNIFYVIILLSLVAFLLIEFKVFNLGDGKRAVSSLLLALAVVSVAVIEIILPVIANRDMLGNRKYLIRTIIKSVLLVTSAVVLFLYEPFGKIKDTTTALIIFCVTYFIQFFISLEPKLEKKSADDEEKSGSRNRAAAEQKAATRESTHAGKDSYEGDE